MFGKFSIGAKLISGFSVLVVLLLTIAAVGGGSMWAINTQSSRALDQRALRTDAKDLDGYVFESQFYAMNGLYYKDNVWMGMGPGGENGIAAVREKVAKLVDQMKTRIPKEHELQMTCDNIKGAFDAYGGLADEWTKFNDQIKASSVRRLELANLIQNAFKRIVETSRFNAARESVRVDAEKKEFLGPAVPDLAENLKGDERKKVFEAFEKSCEEDNGLFSAGRLAIRQRQVGEVLENIEFLRRLTREQALLTRPEELKPKGEELRAAIAALRKNAEAIKFRTGSNVTDLAEGLKQLGLWQEELIRYEGLVEKQSDSFEEMKRKGGEIAALSGKISEYAEKSVAEAVEASNAAFHFGALSVAIVSGVAFFIGIWLAWSLTRSIAGGTRKVTDALHLLVNDGDITVQIDTNLQRRGDEIGRLSQLASSVLGDYNSVSGLAQSLANGDWTVGAQEKSEKDSMNQNLNAMIEKINAALGEVTTAVGQVNSGATQIASASESLSQGATESAASIEEISASMNELASQTNQNAESSGEAAQLAKQTNIAGADGQKMMESMIASMDQITRNSAEVQKVIKVIDDISFQTNLLALNAAVEAARAGQHGKGFAVVAEEVRNLAARCAKAAGETSQMIEGNNKQIGEGAQIASQTAEMLNTIVEHATKTATIINQIAKASNEQAQGITQVNQGLQQIDAVTQQNTASAEETASVSNEMSSQARNLQRLVEFFRLRGQSSRSSYSAPVASPVPVASPTPVASPAPKKSGPTIHLDDTHAPAASKPVTPKPVALKPTAPKPPVASKPTTATTPVGRSGGHINVKTKPTEFPSEPETATKGSGWDTPVSADATINLDDKEFGKY